MELMNYALSYDAILYGSIVSIISEYIAYAGYKTIIVTLQPIQNSVSVEDIGREMMVLFM